MPTVDRRDYTVARGRVYHGKKFHRVGAKVPLTEEEAAPLIAAGFLEPPEAGVSDPDPEATKAQAEPTPHVHGEPQPAPINRPGVRRR